MFLTSEFLELSQVLWKEMPHKVEISKMRSRVLSTLALQELLFIFSFRGFCIITQSEKRIIIKNIVLSSWCFVVRTSGEFAGKQNHNT